MGKKKGGYAGLALISALLLIVGAAMAAIGFFTNVIPEGLVADIVKYAGVALASFGLLFLIICLVSCVGRNKKSKLVNDVAEQNVQADLDSVGSGESVRYIPSESVYQFVNMGDRQTLDEKFNEIQKMDKTQFVIYVARLFSRKGYQVKFTPVFNNHNIDLLVEKMGVTIAVGCILSNKVLCENDIHCVVEGSRYYHASNVMTLTNMYFDRTALDYAKRERMSLVDRNILAEDFMRR
ncbi:MAG: restriction endonuclease [Corallococcus sp.]|nr:restriction endonuclease [Corallococcus sp.]MCM1360165.1 restriction endonuclease [Corallococcus sp.]MCM1395762.1 restriction endonuclease [Corallococcus sp.]